MGKTTQFIARLLSPARRPAPVDASALPAATPDPHSLAVPDAASPLATARELARAIDHAMERGQVELAGRLAMTAARIAPVSARLTESLARLRLATGRPDAALAMIDACRRRPSSLRLLRLACLVELGRSGEAHLDLAEWSRHTTMPLAGRLLLALSEWETGDRARALQLLQDNLAEVEDPLSLELLFILATLEGRFGLASLTAARLERYTMYPLERDEIELFMVSLDRARPVPREVPRQDLERLTLELIACESALPLLVESFERRFDEPSAALLVQAAEQALSELRDQPSAIASMIRLNIRLDRLDLAQRWLARGLAAYPMSTALARVMDDTGLEPDASAAHAPLNAIWDKAA